MKRVVTAHEVEVEVEGIFNAIPDEVLISIFRRVPQDDQLFLCSLSKRFFKLIPKSIEQLTLVGNGCISSIRTRNLLKYCRPTLNRLFIRGIDAPVGIQQLTSLTTLHINAGDYEYDYLSNKVIEELTGLKSLFIRSKHIDNKGLEKLVNLTCLDVSQCSGIDGSSLTNLTKLTRLMFGMDNNVKDEVLSFLTQLTFLRIGTSRFITDKGIECLTNLTTLDLSYNHIVTSRLHHCHY